MEGAGGPDALVAAEEVGVEDPALGEVGGVIPGHVHVVPASPQPHRVPPVVLGDADAGVVGHPRPVQEVAVGQQVPLAHGGAGDQGVVGGVVGQAVVIGAVGGQVVMEGQGLVKVGHPRPEDGQGLLHRRLVPGGVLGGELGVVAGLHHADHQGLGVGPGLAGGVGVAVLQVEEAGVLEKDLVVDLGELGGAQAVGGEVHRGGPALHRRQEGPLGPGQVRPVPQAVLEGPAVYGDGVRQVRPPGGEGEDQTGEGQEDREKQGGGAGSDGSHGEDPPFAGVDSIE